VLRLSGKSTEIAVLG
jgi:hypothetical protein